MSLVAAEIEAGEKLAASVASIEGTPHVSITINCFIVSINVLRVIGCTFMAGNLSE